VPTFSGLVLEKVGYSSEAASEVGPGFDLPLVSFGTCPSSNIFPALNRPAIRFHRTQ
jgi:hypothetical protein